MWSLCWIESDRLGWKGRVHQICRHHFRPIHQSSVLFEPARGDDFLGRTLQACQLSAQCRYRRRRLFRQTLRPPSLALIIDVPESEHSSKQSATRLWSFFTVQVIDALTCSSEITRSNINCKNALMQPSFCSAHACLDSLNTTYGTCT